MRLESEMTNLEWALKYRIELGWNVIPLIPEKKQPRIKWKSDYGLDKRHSTIEEIKQWWNEYPNDAIGMITGDIIVVDCDSRKALKWVIDKKPGRTPHVQSSKLYRIHFYFENTKKIKLKNIVGKNKYVLDKGKLRFITKGELNGVEKVGFSLDIKAQGGIVVLPPSLHSKNVKYKWKRNPFETPLLPIPNWVVDYVNNKKPIPKKKKVISKSNNKLVNEINSTVNMNMVLTYYGINTSKRDNLPCPFCDNKSEHHQSFSWDEHTCRCFSCLADGEGWNIWSFVKEKEQCSSKEAFKILCDIGGIKKNPQIKPKIKKVNNKLFIRRIIPISNTKVKLEMMDGKSYLVNRNKIIGDII